MIFTTVTNLWILIKVVCLREATRSCYDTVTLNPIINSLTSSYNSIIRLIHKLVNPPKFQRLRGESADVRYKIIEEKDNQNTKHSE